jgi:hypothetical protein
MGRTIEWMEACKSLMPDFAEIDRRFHGTDAIVHPGDAAIQIPHASINVGASGPPRKSRRRAPMRCRLPSNPWKRSLRACTLQAF